MTRNVGYLSFLGRIIEKEARDEGDGSPDNCAACKKKVVKLRETLS